MTLKTCQGKEVEGLVCLFQDSRFNMLLQELLQDSPSVEVTKFAQYFT